MILLLSGPSLGTYSKLIKKNLPKGLNLLYIPAWYGKLCKKDFNTIKNKLGNHSILHYFPVDKKLNFQEKELLRSCDGIILDGGNTFFLMKHLRKSGVASYLKKNPKEHYIGLSAGALCLSPSIRLAKYPDFTADDNFVNLKNLKGLGIVDFEISVHFENKKEEVKQLNACAKRSKRKIFTLKDYGFIKLNKKILETKNSEVIKNPS